MSLKPITNDETAINNKSLNMYANSWSGNTINTNILEVKTDDDNYIDYSTPDLGQPNYSLHTDGLGNTFWAPDETTGGDILYNGATPITLGTLTKISDVNGLAIENSVMVETATELQVTGLRITNASDPVDPQDLATKNYVTSVVGGGLNDGVTSGVSTGGIITLTGGPNTAETFNISNGSGYINNLGVITKVSWTGLNNLSRPTDPLAPNPYIGIVTYVSLNSNNDVLYSDSVLTNEQQRNQIFLGVLVHITSPNNPTGQLLTTINNQQLPTLNTGNQIKDIMTALGFINISGNLLSASTLLTFKKSIGYMLGNGINYNNNVKNPHTLTLEPINTFIGTGINVFQYRMQDETSSALTLTNIIPNKLDDGNPYVTAATYGSQQYGVNRVYCFTSQALKIQPPQFSYNNMDAAIEGISSENFQTEPSIAANGLLIGYIVTRGGATNLNNTSDCRFLSAGKFGCGVSTVLGGTQDLQSVYENSLPPQITTNVASGAIVFKRGTALDTNNVIEVQNGGGIETFSVQGDGTVNINDSGIVSSGDLNLTTGATSDINLTTDTFTLTLDETNNAITSNTSTDLGSVTNQFGDVYISGNLIGANVVSSITNVGTTSLVSSSTGALKGLIAGTNITLTPSGTNITIDAAGGGIPSNLVISSKELTSATTPASTNAGVNVLSATFSSIHPDTNCIVTGSGGTTGIQVQKAGSFKVEMFATADIALSASPTQYIGLQICKGSVYNTNVIIDKRFLVPYDNDKIEQSIGCVVDLALNDIISFWINPNSANVGGAVNVSADIGTNINIYSVGSTNGTATAELVSYSNYNLAGSTSAIPSSGSFNASLVQVQGDVTVSSMQVMITTASAGRTIYAGIYNQVGNTLLGESAINASSTGLQSNTLVGGGNFTLLGGSFYWFVWLEGSGAVNIASTTSGSNSLYAKNNFVSGTPTGLPTTIAGIGSGTSSIGWISTL